MNTQQFATFTLSDNKSGNSYVAQDPGQVDRATERRELISAHRLSCADLCRVGQTSQVTASSSIAGVSIAVMEVSFTGAAPQLFSTGQGTGTSSPATVSNAATYGNTLLINLAVQGNVSSTPWTPARVILQSRTSTLSLEPSSAISFSTWQTPPQTRFLPPPRSPGSRNTQSVSWSFSEMPAPTTYYVANAGSDTNSGESASAPFQTLAHAASVAVFGDTILLNGGDTFLPLSSTVGFSISSYGTGQANIPQSSLTSAAIQFSNCSGASVTNINCSGPGAAYAAPRSR